MKTMTITEFEQEVQRLLETVKHGQSQRIQLDVQIVEEPKTWTEADLAQYTPEQQAIIQRGWSPEMAKMLTDVNPDWHLEPDFLPERELDDYYNPFADEKDE
jgi:hypothetical protein